MILVDSNLNLIHDEDKQPDSSYVESIINAGMGCKYADDQTLYRVDSKGVLFVCHLSKPKFMCAHLTADDIAELRRAQRLATDKIVVRGIGCDRIKVYADGYSFEFPAKLVYQ